MSNIEPLLKTAMIGIETSPFDASVLPRAIAEKLQKLDSGEKADLIFAAAAALDACDRVNVQTQKLKKTLEPAPEETKPFASDATARTLNLILMNTQDFAAKVQEELLSQWARLAREKGVLAPPRCLPQLLDYAVHDEALQFFTANISGARGRWLAKMNTNWKWILDYEEVEESDSIPEWDSMPTPTRVGILKKLRETDPTRARELIMSTWSSESAKDRGAFLDTLSIGLSDEDESFLTDALKDRGKMVKLSAAELLSRLPRSAYSQRNMDRLAACIQIKGKVNKSLTIDPPEAWDEAATADCLALREPTVDRLGEGGKRLFALVALTPLNFWKERLKLDPASTVKLLAKTDWAAATIDALWAAVSHHRDSEWAGVLTQFADKKKKGDEWHRDELLGLLQDDDLVAVMQKRSKDTGSLMLSLTGSIPQRAPLSRKLTEALNDVAFAAIKKDEVKYEYYARDFLTQVALAGDLACFPAAEKRFNDILKKLEIQPKSIHQYIDLYRFRYEMHEAFKS